MTVDRWDYVEQCVDLYRASPALTDVQIEPLFPAGALEAESIWLSNIEGVSLEVPTSHPEPLEVDDLFDVTWRFWVSNEDDLIPTVRRCEEMVRAVIAVHQADVEVGLGETVFSALPTNRNGPQAIGTLAEGITAVAELTLQVHLRLD